MTDNVFMVLMILVATAGCIYGAIARGYPLAYGLAWLVIVGALVHWYARRKNILWFTRR